MLKLVLDLIGYVGSGLVVAAMLQKKMKPLRILNAVGAFIAASVLLLTAAFVAGDIMTVSWPVVALNVLIVIVNIVMLIRMRIENDESK